MHRHTLQYGIKFLNLHAVRCVLFILGRDVTRGSGHAALFVLCALQNHLDTIAFFSHGLELKWQHCR